MVNEFGYLVLNLLCFPKRYCLETCYLMHFQLTDYSEHREILRYINQCLSEKLHQ